MKIGKPFSKSKYYLIFDSEQVPWGKNEKEPIREWKDIEIAYIRQLKLYNYFFFLSINNIYNNNVPFV